MSRNRGGGGRVEAKIKHALDNFGVEETMQQAETSLSDIYLAWMEITSIALEISFENLQIVPSLRGGASSGRGVQGVWRAALRSSATRPRDVTATRRRERS